MTIQNVGPEDITASASLVDVYNAGQSINVRWAVQSCKPAVNTNGQIILTMRIGANDSDGYVSSRASGGSLGVTTGAGTAVQSGSNVGDVDPHLFCNTGVMTPICK